jgi:hypothetical protein
MYRVRPVVYKLHVLCMIQDLTMLCVISGFCCSVNEIYILLEFFAV